MSNYPYQRVAEEDNGVVLPLVGIGAGAALAYGSLDSITGTKTLYHGTSKANAEKIKKEGFKASLGGTGGASEAVGHESFVENSKGYVHASSVKPYSNMYANLGGDKEIQDGLKNAMDGVKKLQIEHNEGRLGASDFIAQAEEFEKQNGQYQLKAMLKPHSKKTSEILKMKLPYMEYNDMFIHDEDGGPVRYMAGKTDQDISSKYIKGGEGELTFKERAKGIKDSFPAYAKAHKGRFSAGIAMLGLGIGSAGMGVESLLD